VTHAPDGSQHASVLPVGLGIDIGGTKIAVALVGRDGMIRARNRVPTDARRGGAAVLEAALATARALVADHPKLDVGTCGIGAPGVVKDGQVVSATDLLPGWAGLDVAAEARRVLSMPCQVLNDVQAAAAAELVLGAARNARRALVVTIGTGIGGGLVIDGKIDPGPRGLAGSIGHIDVSVDALPEEHLPRCSCGATNHPEAYASGPAMTTDYRRRSAESHSIELRDVVSRAATGDALAKAALANGGRILGRALASAHTLLDLDLVVLCGGVAASATDFCQAANTELRARVLDPTTSPPVAVSALAEDSGVIGAALTGLGLAATEIDSTAERPSPRNRGS